METHLQQLANQMAEVTRQNAALLEELRLLRQENSYLRSQLSAAAPTPAASQLVLPAQPPRHDASQPSPSALSNAPRLLQSQPTPPDDDPSRVPEAPSTPTAPPSMDSYMAGTLEHSPPQLQEAKRPCPEQQHSEEVAAGSDRSRTRPLWRSSSAHV
jgi:hypothetical protein